MKMHLVQRLLWLLLILCLISGGIVAAQNESIPVTLGENVLGELPAEVASIQYAIEVATPQSIILQLLPVTPGFQPLLQVLDPSGINVYYSTKSQPDEVYLSSVGRYTLVIASSDESTGQFLLSLQPGAPLAEPEPLSLDEVVSGSVDAEDSRRAYSFGGLEGDALILTIDPVASQTGLVIALYDSDYERLLSLSSFRIGGVRYRILAGSANYRLEIIHSGSTTAEPFTICLEGLSRANSCGREDGAAPIVVITPTQVATTAATAAPTTASSPAGTSSACQVTASGQRINVRAGASTAFPIVNGLPANTSAPVVGRLADSSWYQVDVSGALGWVSASVVDLSGDCGSISVVTSPPPPPAALVPTTAPVVPTTASGGTSPTLTPTTEPTVELKPTLDGSLSTGAFTGFDTNGISGAGLTDPFEIPFNINTLVNTANAVVDASYLGAGCSGYTTAGPQYHINYASGTGALQLRFFFLGSGYDTLIIQRPNGSFLCQKVVNVGIQFDGAFSIGGNYSVWVTTPAPNSAPSGTLYASELPTP